MNVLVTGGAGFIGSNLVEKLLSEGNDVTVIDNLSTGKRDFLPSANRNLHLVVGDILDKKKLDEVMKDKDMVFHLAACSDVRKPEYSLEQNVLGTYNVLASMRANSVKRIVFASSQTVYGMTGKTVTEEYGPLIPESLYAASKASCESFISAFSNLYGLKAWIFRFANVVGRNQTHGVVLDFINKLKNNPRELEILGDGKQTKSYMLVDDLIDGILVAFKKSRDSVNIFNICSDDMIAVDDIARIVIDKMGLKDVKLRHTGGSRGWAGDVPSLKISGTKIKNLGWKPRHNSSKAIEIAVGALL